MARYAVEGAVFHSYPQLKFPLATFLVNFLGCLLIGVIFGFLEKHAVLSAGTRLFLITGFLGGFTTFSAFGFESLMLIRRGHLVLAGLNVGGSIVCCLLAVYLGLKLSGFSAQGV